MGPSKGRPFHVSRVIPSGAVTEGLTIGDFRQQDRLIGNRFMVRNFYCCLQTGLALINILIVLEKHSEARESPNGVEICG